MTFEEKLLKREELKTKITKLQKELDNLNKEISNDIKDNVPNYDKINGLYGVYLAALQTFSEHKRDMRRAKNKQLEVK